MTEEVRRSVPAPPLPPDVRLVFKAAERIAYVLRRCVSRLCCCACCRPCDALLLLRVNRRACWCSCCKPGGRPFLCCLPNLCRAHMDSTDPDAPLLALQSKGLVRCGPALLCWYGALVWPMALPLLCLTLLSAHDYVPVPSPHLPCSEQLLLQDPFIQCQSLDRALNYMKRVRSGHWVGCRAALGWAVCVQHSGDPSRLRCWPSPPGRSCAWPAPSWISRPSCFAAATTGQSGSRGWQHRVAHT